MLGVNCSPDHFNDSLGAINSLSSGRNYMHVEDRLFGLSQHGELKPQPLTWS